MITNEGTSHLSIERTEKGRFQLPERVSYPVLVILMTFNSIKICLQNHQCEHYQRQTLPMINVNKLQE